MAMPCKRFTWQKSQICNISWQRLNMQILVELCSKRLTIFSGCISIQIWYEHGDNYGSVSVPTNRPEPQLQP
uniref:Uncharacterized protein n=1 Tax=Arundo donax TaxID=35708 RepID=A0A0A9FJD8_ARUDO